jgi:hypothetical protein
MYDIYGYINACIMSTKLHGEAASLESAATLTIANEVRRYLLIVALSRELASRSYRNLSDSELAGIADMFYKELLRWREENGARRSVIERGFMAAREEQLHPRKRERDVFRRLAASLVYGPTLTHLRSEVTRFVSIASELSIEHPDLKLLSSMIQYPSMAQRILEGNKSSYSFVCLRGDGVSIPLIFRIGHRDVAFVFLRLSALDTFVCPIETVIGKDYETQIFTIVSDTEHDVIVEMHALVENSERSFDVAFEGTAQFAALLSSIPAEFQIWTP